MEQNFQSACSVHCFLSAAFSLKSLSAAIFSQVKLYFLYLNLKILGSLRNWREQTLHGKNKDFLTQTNSPPHNICFDKVGSFLNFLYQYYPSKQNFSVPNVPIFAMPPLVFLRREIIIIFCCIGRFDFYLEQSLWKSKATEADKILYHSKIWLRMLEKQFQYIWFEKNKTIDKRLKSKFFST